VHKLPACFTFSDDMTGEIISDLSKISQGAAREGAQSRFGVPVDVAGGWFGHAKTLLCA
jgi:hypothetical protein